jgi:hypothetical protein
LREKALASFEPFCSVFDVDGFYGTGLGGFTAGILEFLGDIVEAADRQVILHFEDIRADVHAAFTADAEIPVDGGFHFPSFFLLTTALLTAATGKNRKNGT